MDDIPVPIPAGTHRFVNEVRADMHARGYAYPTERTYLHWIKRYIHFNGRRHPKDMGKGDKDRTTLLPSLVKDRLQAPTHVQA